MELKKKIKEYYKWCSEDENTGYIMPNSFDDFLKEISLIDKLFRQSSRDTFGLVKRTV